MAVENNSKSISTQVLGRVGIELTTHRSAIGLAADCDTGCSPDFIVCTFMENCIGLKKVNAITHV